MVDIAQIKSLKGFCEEAHKLHATNCSGAVKHIASQMGYALPDVDANGLIDYFTQAGWEAVDETRAQTYADANRLVVGGKKETGHGHVIVVLPGGMARSGGYSYVNRKDGKTKTAAYHGNHPRMCSTSASGWEGAISAGDKSGRDAWSATAYASVKYWVAPETK